MFNLGFMVRRRKRNSPLFATGANTVTMGYLAFNVDYQYIFIAFFVIAALFLFELIFALVHLFIKPQIFQLVNDSIQIGDQTYTSDQIKSIIIEEYYGPHIGIKPKGRRFVPMMNAYRVQNKQEADEAFESLHDWGDKYNVPVLTQRMWML
ncbi:hypothetical protein M3231_07205 [Neobacillus mesonae]|nr:hypothetical protein [Neobacillus mesonae]